MKKNFYKWCKIFEFKQLFFFLNWPRLKRIIAFKWSIKASQAGQTRLCSILTHSSIELPSGDIGGHLAKEMKRRSSCFSHSWLSRTENDDSESYLNFYSLRPKCLIYSYHYLKQLFRLFSVVIWQKLKVNKNAMKSNQGCRWPPLMKFAHMVHGTRSKS